MKKFKKVLVIMFVLFITCLLVACSENGIMSSQIETLQLGLYEYVVSNDIKDEVGPSLHNLGINLKDEENFKIVLEKGCWIDGTYEVVDEKLICTSYMLNISVSTEERDVENIEIDEKYIFEINDNNELELVKTEGQSIKESGLFNSRLLQIGSKFFYTRQENYEETINELVDLKGENLKKENLEEDVDLNYNQEEYSKKIIEYSLTYNFEKDNSSTIYFGHLEGRDSDKNTRFIQYNGEIVGFEVGDDINGEWKDAISIIDIEASDSYIELAVETCYTHLDDKFLEIYRIVNNKLKYMGATYHMYKKDGRLCDDCSYLDVISEDLLIGYYEIVDHKLVKINKFEDGKVSISSEGQVADYSSISKNKYTVTFPMVILDSYSEDTGDYSFLNVGEKIQILEITDSQFQDMKVQRENGDVVNVTTTIAGRI